MFPFDRHVVPERTADPRRARELVAAHGCAVLTGQQTSQAASRAIAHAVFGGEVLEVPEPAEVRTGGDRDRRPDHLDHTVGLPPHTDGFSYGERYPDHFLLVCVASSPEGGESFLVDGYAVIDALVADDQTDLVEWLAATPVDQTEPDMQPSISPILGVAPSGRTMLRLFPYQRPAPTSTDPELDATMIARWQAVIEEVASMAPRFRLEPGDAVIIDNYRHFHGRDSYTDLSRHMWRVWLWTTTAYGVPSGLLHSDSRYAIAT